MYTHKEMVLKRELIANVAFRIEMLVDSTETKRMGRNSEHDYIFH